jgi:hypothetical protein
LPSNNSGVLRNINRQVNINWLQNDASSRDYKKDFLLYM